MKRYHTTMGTGDGIEAGIMREIPESIDSGFWVYYADAEHEIEAAYARGFQEGLARAQPIETVIAAQPKAEDDSDRKRLLNELYHDRARLERQVQQACELIRQVQEYATNYQWVDDEGERIDNDYPLYGSLEQFADSHEE